MCNGRGRCLFIFMICTVFALFLVFQHDRTMILFYPVSLGSQSYLPCWCSVQFHENKHAILGILQDHHSGFFRYSMGWLWRWIHRFLDIQLFVKCSFILCPLTAASIVIPDSLSVVSQTFVLGEPAAMFWKVLWRARCGKQQRPRVKSTCTPTTTCVNMWVNFEH